MQIRRAAKKLCSRMLSWLGVAASVALSPAFASAQLPLSQLEHKSWGLQDGAPLNIIDLKEDRRGVIWLTSPSGLYTFNGSTFAPFKLPQNIDPAADFIFTISSAFNGDIWGASRIRGVVRIDPQLHVVAYGPEQGLPGHAVTDVREDHKGDTWAIADGNLYHLVQEHWRNETRQRGLPEGDLVCDLVDSKGTLWVATNTALLSQLPGQAKFEAVKDRWDPGYAPGQLSEDASGAVWVALHDAKDSETILRRMGKTGGPVIEIKPIILPYSFVDTHFDRSGALWATGRGVDRVTLVPAGSPKQGGAPQDAYTTEHFGVSNGLSSDSTRAVLLDSQNDIWVATMRGLERFRKPILIKASSPVIDATTVPDMAAGRDGKVLLGGKDVPLYEVQGNLQATTGPAVDSYYCLFQDSRGDIWFNSHKGLWQKHGEQVLPLPPPEGANFGRLRQVVELPDHSLLFSFYNKGVWRRVEDRWELTSIGKSLGEFPTVMLVDSKGELWAGYPSGRITRGNGVTEAPAAASDRKIGPIQGFFDSSLGLLASGQRGVAALIHDRFEQLRFANQAVALNVSGFVQSQNGDLWMNGQRGVARISSEEFRKGVQSVGVHAIEGRLFTQTDIHGPAPFFYDLPTAAKDGTGRLWFNTSGALVYVDPSQVASEAPLPTMSVAGLLVDGQPLETGAAVPPGSHTVRIGYFGSNLAAPEDVRYRYKLTGVDDTWQEVEGRTEAVYTHLRPGNYTFQVSATSGDGIWATPVISQFRVEPAYYQTTGFRLLCVICFLALCVLVYKWRVHSVFKRYQERAEERAEERVRMARDLHDTLLQGFQGLMLRFHVAAMQLPEESDTREQLEGALVRAEKIMVEGRNRVSLLRSDDLRGVSLRSALLAVCTELAAPGCPTSIVEDVKPEIELKDLIKDEVYWIAREALTNAFRHAEAKQVKISLAYERREFRLTCEDDGRGLDKEVETAGGRPGHYGLPGICERARRVNAKLHYTSAPMKGTRVELTVPGHFAYAERNTLRTRLRSTFASKASYPM